MALNDVLQKIRDEEKRVGRAVGATRLVAVSKVQPLGRVVAVLDDGHRLFGENKVQEAAGKWPDLREKYNDVVLHLIGPLQTNKARQAMELFDVIETIDRPKLARTIARLAEETGHCPRLFVQVNTGEEEQKAGVMPEDVDAFLAECRDLGLRIEGLMCIPPVDEEPSLHFALLAKIAKRNGIEELSMGMSGDFERAVAQGATYVRVGSAIFGDRVYD
ncbi:YggS family pyridoxal phosphate-dependent enzyme [Maritimibacter dapengensis]|uniref:Pyridoxal phosphate homeostasis protein n=1 Tax=Maritimibacter dapengensis TaxID=2836868 RepID=A0ABS6T5J2_9RHOB|nr:YggS family pyridoxal phosphate-dependent enzyme [Maritimibacter dapengensis]MBV7380250.1 YggS family pyridoxal phosphate-dependent enzyme [Maritimibacter dapengensis]